MRPLYLLVFTLLLACALPAIAEDGVQQQMTPEQFKAAGLDKLSPEELANLNAWLNRTIDSKTTAAAAVAEKKVKDENRGFFNFGSIEAIDSKVAGEFNGFGKNKLYTLDNGQQWRQTDTAKLVGVRKTNPEVTITPGMIGNVWYMRIKGYNTRAKVERVK